MGNPSVCTVPCIVIYTQYLLVGNAISICIIITGISNPIPISIFLSRVWDKSAIVLDKKGHKSGVL